MTSETLKFPLSNIQLKLLQLFSQNVSDEDLKAIQRMKYAILQKKPLMQQIEIGKKKAMMRTLY